MEKGNRKAPFFWPLMKETVTVEDRRSIAEFVLSAEWLTNGPKVGEFEKAWSEWQGCEHSLFVSSGSAANLLLLAGAIEHYGIKPGAKVAVPAITWSTHITPVIQMGLTPVFCDVNPRNFAMDPAHLQRISDENPDMNIIFAAHLLGIPAPVKQYREILPNAVFLEDSCESHGAQTPHGKVGSLFSGGTFSFYFGHHMTTLEGGMVCVKEENLYEIMRAKRSHGLARECGKNRFERFKSQSPDVDERFLFITDGFNCRNTEIGAVLGLRQLERLDAMIARRREVLGKFGNMTWEKHPDLFSSFQTEGNSSFCLPFACKTQAMNTDLRKFLYDKGVDSRPFCGGNLLRQPFLAGKFGAPEDFPNADYLHFHGFYIGNNHLITDDEIETLENLLEEFLGQSMYAQRGGRGGR
ncbi:MAG: DegT/DnrJ/EryC1/StrS aminotransferase family protein [Gammaproteobacteria bacterium]|nr:DegT/DnrJ/EryC1/StrS aminotransferase family protein [Gammaproteobacteria bacterium]